jgi:WD40 repeat protein
MSDGTLTLFDCAKAQKIRSKLICNSAINAIAHFNSASNKVLIACADLGIQQVQVSPKIALTDGPLSGEKARRKKKNSVHLLCISGNDKLALSADSKGNLQVQSLEETKQEVNWTVAAHQERLTAAAFISDDLIVTASADPADSASVWRVGTD